MVGWGEGDYGATALHQVGNKSEVISCNRKGNENARIERMFVRFTVSCFWCRSSGLSSIPFFRSGLAFLFFNDWMNGVLRKRGECGKQRLWWGATGA